MPNLRSLGCAKIVGNYYFDNQYRTHPCLSPARTGDGPPLTASCSVEYVVPFWYSSFTRATILCGTANARSTLRSAECAAVSKAFSESTNKGYSEDLLSSDCSVIVPMVLTCSVQSQVTEIRLLLSKTFLKGDERYDQQSSYLL